MIYKINLIDLNKNNLIIYAAGHSEDGENYYHNHRPAEKTQKIRAHIEEQVGTSENNSNSSATNNTPSFLNLFNSSTSQKFINNKKILATHIIAIIVMSPLLCLVPMSREISQFWLLIAAYYCPLFYSAGMAFFLFNNKFIYGGLIVIILLIHFLLAGFMVSFGKLAMHDTSLYSGATLLMIVNMVLLFNLFNLQALLNNYTLMFVFTILIVITGIISNIINLLPYRRSNQ